MRWIRDKIVSQPSLSLDSLSHFNDSRAAKEEIEHIVKGLTLFDDGLRVSCKRVLEFCYRIHSVFQGLVHQKLFSFSGSAVVNEK